VTLPASSTSLVGFVGSRRSHYKPSSNQTMLPPTTRMLEESLIESASPHQATRANRIDVQALARAAFALLRRRPLQAGVGTLVVAQAVWFWFLMRQGWFYQADFENLASAAQSPLTWDYLTSAQGGHLGLVGRPLFWIMQRGFGLDYGPTLALRIALQAAATALLARLLVDVVGPRLGVLGILAAYCFSPLLIPGTAWLTSGISLTLCQLLFIQALGSWIHYNKSRQLRAAAAASVCLLLGTAANDSGYALALVIPMLSLGWGYSGGGRDRIRAMFRQWFGWLMLVTPVAGLAATILFGGYAEAAATPVAASGYARLFGTALFRVLFPSLVGGPWRWSTPGDNYLAFANPPLLASIAGGLIWAGVLVIGVRRVGRIAMLAWAMPLMAMIATMALVGAGRYSTFGTITALAYRYTHLLAAPLALSAALVLWPAGNESASPRPGVAPPKVRHGLRRPAREWRSAGVFGLAIVLAISGCMSAIAFTHEWSKSPARTFVSNLRTGLRSSSNANTYDSYVPVSVIPGLQKHRHISDILSISGQGTRLNPLGTRTKVADAKGNLVAATFLVTARGVRRPKAPCVLLAKGVGNWTVPLDEAPQANEWFLRLEYYQQRPSSLHITVTGESGPVSPASGAQTDLRTRLDAIWIRLPTVAPSSVTFASSASLTNVCVTKVEIGYPFPTGRSK
jgi:hypothetical protein